MVAPLRRFFHATIDITTKHLVSSMRNGSVLHRTRFHQSVIKFGQRYYTKPVSDEKAMEAGAEMLVCYTDPQSPVWSIKGKKYWDEIKYVRLETEQLKQTEVEQAMKQLRQKFQIYMQSMRGIVSLVCVACPKKSKSISDTYYD